MEHFPEFFSNNLFLFGAFFVVLALVIKAEFEYQTSKGSQISPVNAIRIMNNENAVILDVRTAAEFERGHIKGAINLPLTELAGKINTLEKYKEQPVLAYCNSGQMSGKACRMLLKSGFTKAHNITGGVSSWLDSNLPLTKN